MIFVKKFVMNYIVTIIGLLFLLFCIYIASNTNNIDENTIKILEEQIKISQKKNRQQEEKVKIAIEMTKKIHQSRSVIDEILLDLQYDLIEKLASKN